MSLWFFTQSDLPHVSPCWLLRFAGLPVCWQFWVKLSIMCWIIRISILICNCDQCDWRESGEEGGKPRAISAPRVLHHRLHISSDESKHSQSVHSSLLPNTLLIEMYYDLARHNNTQENTQQSTWLDFIFRELIPCCKYYPVNLKSVRFSPIAI